MTTGGEGGMVTCNDRDLWSRMWSFKDHGKSWSAVYERDHPPGFRWLHESFGTNWRMLEMQAAIGRIQLGRMPDWHAARTRNASVLAAALREFIDGGLLRVPVPGESASSHAYYKFYAYLEPARLNDGWTRDRLVDEIKAAGVPCYQGSCSEVYLEHAFEGSGLQPSERLTNARELGETSIMWLVHPTLTEAEVKTTAEVSRQVIAQALS